MFCNVTIEPLPTLTKRGEEAKRMRVSFECVRCFYTSTLDVNSVASDAPYALECSCTLGDLRDSRVEQTTKKQRANAGLGFERLEFDGHVVVVSSPRLTSQTRREVNNQYGTEFNVIDVDVEGEATFDALPITELKLRMTREGVLPSTDTVSFTLGEKTHRFFARKFSFY
jgi:hypothetical protein